jgi:hypothetical protein
MNTSQGQPGLDDVTVWGDCLPPPLHAELLERLNLGLFTAMHRSGFKFYHSTFWYPVGRAPSHLIERVIEVLREAVQPSAQVVGVEWWFSVLRTNASPQWLLPCHFDRNDIDEQDPRNVRHPQWGSVFFFNEVPYGELVITDQVIDHQGLPSPDQPRHMRFVPPGINRYAVFPGHLYHGVIGRMWRPREDDQLRVTMAVNWWTEQPRAAYLRDSSEAPAVFSLDRPVAA